MNAIIQFVVRHGYPILFAAVFARQMGLPLPTPAFLLAAGALAASGKLQLLPALAMAVTGCVLADWLWYEAGRAWGDKVLHFILFFAPDPEALERRARRMFDRHGPPLLVLDKFVPGLDAVVAPLAGTSDASRIHLLAFETIGASLWASAYAGLGYVFSHHLDRVAEYVARAGKFLAAVLMVALVIYVICKLVRWRRSRAAFRVVRVAPVCPMRRGLDRQSSEILEGVHHDN
jgi:membrane protein DedA with SNARE-associated domain